MGDVPLLAEFVGGGGSGGRGLASGDQGVVVRDQEGEGDFEVLEPIAAEGDVGGPGEFDHGPGDGGDQIGGPPALAVAAWRRPNFERSRPTRANTTAG